MNYKLLFFIEDENDKDKRKIKRFNVYSKHSNDYLGKIRWRSGWRCYVMSYSNADMSIGSRYKSGVNVVDWPIGRVLLSYCASVYVRIITGMNIKDTTAGFKCYKRRVLQTIDLDNIKSKGYAFQIEMKFTAWKYGFNIIEIPIVFTDRKKGTSKMSGGIFNEAIWGVIKMKWCSLFKKYEKPDTNNTNGY